MMGLEGGRSSWEVDVVEEVGMRRIGGLSICGWWLQQQWQCLHVTVIFVVKLQMNQLK